MKIGQLDKTPNKCFEKAKAILQKELPNSEVTEYNSDGSKCVLLLTNPDDSEKAQSKELIQELSPCILAWEFDLGWQRVPDAKDLSGRMTRRVRNFTDYLTLYFKK